MSRTGVVAEKIAKQIAFQVDLSAQQPRALYTDAEFVDLEHVAGLIAQQTRRPVASVTKDVKVELEALVADGTLLRWLDVYGPSVRAVRADHYVIAELRNRRV